MVGERATFVVALLGLRNALLMTLVPSLRPGNCRRVGDPAAASRSTAPHRGRRCGPGFPYASARSAASKVWAAAFKIVSGSRRVGVGVGRDPLRGASEQGAGMGQDQRVVVHVDDPGIGGHALGDLVGLVGGGQARRRPHLGRADRSGWHRPVEPRLPRLDAVHLQPRPGSGPNRDAEDRRRRAPSGCSAVRLPAGS
jgi:hypothetical protein